MTAFARRAEGIDRIAGLSALVVGDGRSSRDVLAAVAGRDAVISAVGSPGRGRGSQVWEVTSTIIDAMRESGVRRLVTVSADGVVATHPRVIASVVRWVFRELYADLVIMEQAVGSSGLDWTIVRPTRLTNGPAAGRVRRVRGEVTHGPYRVSRADLAAVLIDVATSDDDIGHAIEVTGERRSALAAMKS